MTENEWMACTDPTPMLELLQRQVSERTLLLFGVACCRRIWHLLTDERSRGLVEKVEHYADGSVTTFDISDASDIHDDAKPTYDFKAPWWAAMYVTSPYHCQQTASEAAEAAGCEAWWGIIPDEDGPIIEIVHSAGRQAESEAQCRLLRDIFGNPFRPASIDAASHIRNDSTVVNLAQVIYDKRAFDRLPILADALEEAGYTNADILTHCRDAGPHVKGCWVIDLILGKQ